MVFCGRDLKDTDGSTQLLCYPTLKPKNLSRRSMAMSYTDMKGNTRQKREFYSHIGGRAWIKKSMTTSKPVTNAKRQKLCTAPVHSPKSKRAHWLVWTLKNFGKWKKIHHGHDRWLFKIGRTSGLANKEAQTVAVALFNQWICRYGMPEEILSDGGKEFCNNIVNPILKMMNIKKTTTSPCHPQTNAQAEVCNKCATRP